MTIRPARNDQKKEETVMHHIILDSETDFDGWRKAARAMR